MVFENTLCCIVHLQLIRLHNHYLFVAMDETESEAETEEMMCEEEDTYYDEVEEWDPELVRSVKRCYLCAMEVRLLEGEPGRCMCWWQCVGCNKYASFGNPPWISKGDQQLWCEKCYDNSEIPDYKLSEEGW